jgi:hypothetical protein
MLLPVDLLALPVWTVPVDVEPSVETEYIVVLTHQHLSVPSDLRLSGCRCDVHTNGSVGEGVKGHADQPGLVARRTCPQRGLGDGRGGG